MSGHSKWKTIKHQKGAADAKRGQLFTKLTRELMMAARSGGPDPAMNARLRVAVDKARDGSMPMDNIDRAIKRATGGADGATLEEVVYEGYAPGGAAIMVFVVTDNKNRAVSEIRNVLDRNGGKLGQSGTVSWSFENKGVINVEVADPAKADEIALLAIDLGAEDFTVDGSDVEIRCDPATFESLRKALEQRKVKIASADLTMVPKSLTTLDERTAEQTLRLLDKLEEMDDVQRVATNADFPEAAIERYKTAAA